MLHHDDDSGDPPLLLPVLLMLLICDRVRSNKLLALNVVSLATDGGRDTDTRLIANRYRVAMVSSVVWAIKDMDMEGMISELHFSDY
jgi:hypothetical protein